MTRFQAYAKVYTPDGPEYLNPVGRPQATREYALEEAKAMSFYFWPVSNPYGPQASRRKLFMSHIVVKEIP